MSTPRDTELRRLQRHWNEVLAREGLHVIRPGDDKAPKRQVRSRVAKGFRGRPRKG